MSVSKPLFHELRFRRGTYKNFTKLVEEKREKLNEIILRENEKREIEKLESEKHAGEEPANENHSTNLKP